jgi:hypothetical protein
MTKALLILFLFSLISCTSYSPSGSYSFNAASRITSASKGLIRYFLKFAGIAYCYDNEYKTSICDACSVEPDWVKVDSGRENSNSKSYNYIIFKSTKFQKVVVALPGTRGSEIIKELLKAGLRSYGNYKIVRYFKERADGIRSKVRNGLKKALNGASNYQVIFTGHSLGGAVSSVLALYMYEDGVISTRNSITLVTYGQPKTGNKKFVDKIMSIAKVFRIVRDNDLVVSLAAVDVPIINDTEHLGGKIKLNHKMTQYYVCPYSQRSLFIGTCTNIKLPKIKSHSYLANDASLADYCRK